MSDGKPPNGCRAFEPEVEAGHSEAWGWACRTLVVVRTREVEVAGLLARCGTVSVNDRSVARVGAVQGGEAMSWWHPGWAGKAWNNGTSPRSFFPRIRRGPSGGRGATLRL